MDHGTRLLCRHGRIFTPVSRLHAISHISKAGSLSRVAGFLDMPKISRAEIWDKSKADMFAKSVASFQAVWLVAQVISRGIQQLPITLLELSTVALVSCTGAAVYFWFSKPLNVDTPTIINLNVSITEILFHAGRGPKAVWRETPLDFIEPDVYTTSQLPFGRYLGVKRGRSLVCPNDRGLSSS